MKKLAKPIILVVLVALLLSLSIIPIPSSAVQEMPGVITEGQYGWTCICPLPWLYCGCVFTDPPKE